MVIPLIVGGLVAAATGTVLSDFVRRRRGLSLAERAEAELVFAATLDYDRIRLVEGPIMGVGGMARTLPRTIFFPPGTLGRPLESYMPWLIHELTHSWQYQHGISVFTTAFHAVRGNYDYGGEAGLRAAHESGKRFGQFNTEQQGDICRSYYKRIKAGRDTSAFAPYLAEVRQNRS